MFPALRIRLSDPIVTGEDDGDVQVCATSTDENCTADFPFNLNIRTVFDTTGITMNLIVWVQYMHCYKL